MTTTPPFPAGTTHTIHLTDKAIIADLDDADIVANLSGYHDKDDPETTTPIYQLSITEPVNGPLDSANTIYLDHAAALHLARTLLEFIAATPHNLP